MQSASPSRHIAGRQSLIIITTVVGLFVEIFIVGAFLILVVLDRQIVLERVRPQIVLDDLAELDHRVGDVRREPLHEANRRSGAAFAAGRGFIDRFVEGLDEVLALLPVDRITGGFDLGFTDVNRFRDCRVGEVIIRRERLFTAFIHVPQTHTRSTHHYYFES